MKLVIIEGPGKRDTLKKYLGSDYDVVATKGHIRDLPQRSMGVDITHNFEPNYEIMKDKESIIKELKYKASKANTVLLATDPDREGEAISWHIQNILNIDSNVPCRIEFNEISQNTVLKAVDHPRTINMNLVHAQQGRRVLDRLVGYKISPIICKKIKANLSAGRVQSVALKLVVDKEKEIKNFKPVEYWSIVAMLEKGNSVFKASLEQKNGKKYTSGSEKETNEVLTSIKGKDFVVSSVKKTVAKTSAPPPFITSTLQQDALNKIGMPLKKVTSSAQQLYEGVDIKGEGKVALITYIRTDSTRVSPEAQAKTKDFIIKNFGPEYAPKSYNFFKTKKNAQDAHEAIRPISMDRRPEDLKASLTPDNYKLYKLIYERFLASQMSDATYNSLVAMVTCEGYGFKVTGKSPIFAGFTAVYKPYEEEKEDAESKLPNLSESDVCKLKDVKYEQKFTKPPTRYTEASLVKAMEDKGIGRPATYAPTILVLANRNYTEKDGKYLKPTELGTTVTEFLEKYFEDIMNISFTAEMESNLDRVEDGQMSWQKVVTGFYSGFDEEVRHAMYGTKMKVAPVESDVVCEKCGAKMVIREGKYGKFLACPNYPNCKNIKSLDDKPKVKAGPVGKCPVCGKDVFERRSKAGKIFYGCSGYPDCKFASWDIPTERKCPKCGQYLTKKELKKETRYACSNKDCDYKVVEPVDEK